MYWNKVVCLWQVDFVRLTLTWDVLKYADIDPSKMTPRININMRCIEIVVWHLAHTFCP